CASPSIRALSTRALPRCTLLPYTTLFRSSSSRWRRNGGSSLLQHSGAEHAGETSRCVEYGGVREPTTSRVPADRADARLPAPPSDRKSTRLNSSHVKISYAVFCLKKKNQT